MSAAVLKELRIDFTVEMSWNVVGCAALVERKPTGEGRCFAGTVIALQNLYNQGGNL